MAISEREHLLICLAEECAEVIQACSKALRFGLDDDHQSANPDIVSPRKYIVKELADLTAVIEMLYGQQGITHGQHWRHRRQENKAN